MTPAERLRAAADLIERTGAKATPGPWECGIAVVATPEPPEDPTAKHEADAAWIALLGPDTAPALAAWLRSVAAAKWPQPLEQGASFFDALAFADLILRGRS